MKSEGKSPQRRKDDDRSFHLARRVSLLWSAYFSVKGCVDSPPSSMGLWGRSHAPSYRQSCTSEYTTRVRRPSLLLTRTNNHINRDNWRSHRVPGTERDLWGSTGRQTRNLSRKKTLMNHRDGFNSSIQPHTAIHRHGDIQLSNHIRFSLSSRNPGKPFSRGNICDIFGNFSKIEGKEWRIWSLLKGKEKRLFILLIYLGKGYKVKMAVPPSRRIMMDYLISAAALPPPPCLLS